MPTLMPKDADSNVIPALRLKASGGAHAIAASAASARNATAFNADTQVLSVYATGPVYLRFGTSSVTAASTDHYYPDGIYYDFAIGCGDSKGPRFTHLAVLAAGAACTVFVSEKE
ncbi:MAG: hypothetical protein DI551_04515 [Micavibrio aeruginosavorus]|uniref:Uncharacterized protein n=1 Tax=Micavibrio aeruginosavorus TaxID=349221 RepID=A0A2W5PQ67_9BACT|nr:MAG: hypothetical protein DI551_04515 [Micavibrio aeruginosavorus]